MIMNREAFYLLSLIISLALGVAVGIAFCITRGLGKRR
jgi:hypothetical protein